MKTSSLFLLTPHSVLPARALLPEDPEVGEEGKFELVGAALHPQTSVAAPDGHHHSTCGTGAIQR